MNCSRAELRPAILGRAEGPARNRRITKPTRDRARTCADTYPDLTSGGPTRARTLSCVTGWSRLFSSQEGRLRSPGLRGTWHNLDMAALIAYLRTPSEPFAGLDDQRQAVRAWATKRRHQVLATFEDDHGTDLQERPALISAVSVLGEGGIDGIVVCQLASLDEDLVAQEQLLAEIHKLGAKVYSLNAHEAAELRRTPADSSRQVVREVLQAAADNEPSLAAIRSAARSGSGGRQGGSPPFGYRVDSGQLVPDADEQAALVRISQLRSEGATLREIARALEAEGHRTKRSNRWHPETLRRIAGRAEP